MIDTTSRLPSRPLAAVHHAALTIFVALTILLAGSTPASALIGFSTVATNAEARWVARIGTVCTGSLIAADTVVTAAHCLEQDGRKPPPTITVGWRNFTNPDDPRDDYVTRQIAGTAVHPLYEKGKPQFDIATITLREPVTDRDPVRIGAPGIAFDYDGVGEDWTDLTLHGYGRTTPTSASSPVPRRLETKLRDHAYMESIWNSPQYFNYARSRHLGAGGQLDGSHEGPCNGDSGGPMTGSGTQYQTRTRGEHVHADYRGPILMGIYSTHLGECGTNPGLYQRVDQGQLLDWLIETVDTPLYCSNQTRYGTRSQWTISPATNQASCTTP